MDLRGLVDEARFDDFWSGSFRDDLGRLDDGGRSSSEESRVGRLVRSEEEVVGGDGRGGGLDLDPLFRRLVDEELSSGGEWGENVLFQS